MCKTYPLRCGQWKGFWESAAQQRSHRPCEVPPGREHRCSGKYCRLCFPVQSPLYLSDRLNPQWWRLHLQHPPLVDRQMDNKTFKHWKKNVTLMGTVSHRLKRCSFALRFITEVELKWGSLHLWLHGSRSLMLLHFWENIADKKTILEKQRKVCTFKEKTISLKSCCAPYRLQLYCCKFIFAAIQSLLVASFSPYAPKCEYMWYMQIWNIRSPWVAITYVDLQYASSASMLLAATIWTYNILMIYLFLESYQWWS